MNIEEVNAIKKQLLKLIINSISRIKTEATELEAIIKELDKIEGKKEA